MLWRMRDHLPGTLVILLAASACRSAPADASDAVPPPEPAVETAEPATLAAAADEARYAYSEANPVLVGGDDPDGGPARERRYLDRLRGPDGQSVTYVRLGSCCPFETPNAKLYGLLDMYEVTYSGLAEPVVLYLNMYDPGEARAPDGFTLRD
jgi:hypothetical protein